MLVVPGIYEQQKIKYSLVVSSYSPLYPVLPKNNPRETQGRREQTAFCDSSSCYIRSKVERSSQAVEMENQMSSAS
jgi:hypothetical protein